MQKKRFILKSFLSLFLVLGFLITLQSCKKTTELPSPPETNAVEVLDNLHGTEIADSYRWLEDQESPETREWINAQNAHTDLILTPLPGRVELKELLTKLIRIDTLGMPTQRAGRYFFHKRNADQELSVIYMREGLRGDDSPVCHCRGTACRAPATYPDLLRRRRSAARPATPVHTSSAVAGSGMAP